MTSIEEVVIICRNNGKAFYNGINIFSKEITAGVGLDEVISFH